MTPSVNIPFTQWPLKNAGIGITARYISRRARRGSMLIGVTLGLVLWVIALSYWINIYAYEQRIAHARGLAVVVERLAADFDFYVHENRVVLAAEMSDVDALILSPVRSTEFLETNWRHAIANLEDANSGFTLSLNGLDIALWVALSDDVETDNEDVETDNDDEENHGPVGVIVLSAQTGESRLLASDVFTQLSRRGVQVGRNVISNFEDTGAQSCSIFEDTQPPRQCAFTTPTYSGLSANLVLRENRAGHKLNQVLNTAISFELTAPVAPDAEGEPQHSVVGIRELNAMNIIAAIRVVVGECAEDAEDSSPCPQEEGTFVFEPFTIEDDITISRDLTAAGDVSDCSVEPVESDEAIDQCIEVDSASSDFETLATLIAGAMRLTGTLDVTNRLTTKNAKFVDGTYGSVNADRVINGNLTNDDGDPIDEDDNEIVEDSNMDLLSATPHRIPILTVAEEIKVDGSLRSGIAGPEDSDGTLNAEHMLANTANVRTIETRGGCTGC